MRLLLLRLLKQYPLVQYYRYAKGDILTQEREKEKAEIARRRHEARLLASNARRWSAKPSDSRKIGARCRARQGTGTEPGTDRRATGRSRRDAAMQEAAKRRSAWPRPDDRRTMARPMAGTMPRKKRNRIKKSARRNEAPPAARHEHTMTKPCH